MIYCLVEAYLVERQGARIPSHPHHEYPQPMKKTSGKKAAYLSPLGVVPLFALCTQGSYGSSYITGGPVAMIKYKVVPPNDSQVGYQLV